MPASGIGQRLKALIRSHGAFGVTTLIVLATAAFRLSAYGDPRASIGTMDTPSYMAHAGALAQPQSAFIGERLLTTGILYRLWDTYECDLNYVSIPAIGREGQPGLQDCFAGLALTQVALSILGWSVFIASVTRVLDHHISKLLAASLLSAFAFSPQLADWDSILSSESLAFSLLALSLGLGILGIRASSGGGEMSRQASGLISGSILVGLAWLFVRDAHVYPAVILLGLLLLWSLWAPARRRLIAILAAAALALCFLALTASRASGRWEIPLTNAFASYILPFKERVREMQELGMPDAGTEAYDAWFAERAPDAYARFLVAHPVFVLNTLAEHANLLFAENSQPYFKLPDRPLRERAFMIGDFLHTKSVSVVILDFVLVATSLVSAAGRRSTSQWPISVLLAGLLASACLGLVLTFFADTIGVERHVLLSIMLFRLVTWTGLVLVVDAALGAASGSGPAVQSN